MHSLFLPTLTNVLTFLLMIGIRLAFPAIIALIGYQAIRTNNKARELTKQWAEENGWELVEFSWRWNKGPFKEWRRRGDAYYQFAVVDKKGRRRAGWVRYFIRTFGGWDQDVMWAESAA